MSFNRYSLGVLVLACFAVAFVGLAIIGGVHEYSPVPYWDMWDGFVDNYMHVQDGDLGAFWAQHNEHRIVLARLISWVDLRYLHGNGIIHLITNYLLVALQFGLLRLALREKLPSDEMRTARTALALTTLALLYAWIQEANFAVGFQTQFFFSQLLPFCGFYGLYRAQISAKHSELLFGLACLAGILSVGTMAGGVLALPIMTLLAVLLGLGWRRVLFLAVLAVTMGGLYFHGYSRPSDHGSILATLLHQPLDSLKFILLYIGGPASFMTGGRIWVGILVGAVILLLFAYRGYGAIRNRATSGLDLALLCVALNVVGVATATASGRLLFGLGAALSSRYMTPPILAWCTLLVLLAPMLARAWQKHCLPVLVALVLPLCLLLPSQLSAVQSHSADRFNAALAGLAATMDVNDPSQLYHVYPHPERVLLLSKAMRERHLSIFSQAPYRTIASSWGQPDQALPGASCQGHIDAVHELPEAPDTLKVEGWLFDSATQQAPGFIRIDDEDGRVVGYALSGVAREDLQREKHGNTAATGFVGYVSGKVIGRALTLRGEGPSCALTGQHIPANALPPIRLHDVLTVLRTIDPASVKGRFATLSDIVGQNDWTGTDSQHTVFPGYRAVGSFIHSDQDTGAIHLQLHRGSVVFYRSGPVMGQQRIEIDGGKIYRGELPFAMEWVLLDFSGPALPDRFEVTLHDDGQGWGEWSAVGLAEH